MQRCIINNNESNYKASCIRVIKPAQRRNTKVNVILEWTTSLDTSSRTLFVREGGRREGGRDDVCRDVHVTSNVELRNNVRLLLNVDLRNYVISRQIVI